jgi:uncharacterized LabA/DUF88 family protein
MSRRIAVFVDGFNLYYALLDSTFSRPEDEVVGIKYFSAMVDGADDPQRPLRQQVYLRALQMDGRVSVHIGNFLRKTIDRPIERIFIPDHELLLPDALVTVPSGVHKTIDRAGVYRDLCVFSRDSSINEVVTRPVFARVLTREEKGSDVNLAVHMLHGAWRNEYDQAVVLSNDADLIAPIQMIRDDLGKIATVCYVPQNRRATRVSSGLQNAASGVLHISWAKLRAHQYPDSISLRNGSVIRKPPDW